IAKNVRSETLASLLRVARDGGLYSSSSIEKWLEERLRELLPDAPRPVRFRDLILPTFIVATDLQASSIKIWNNFDTPQDSVAFAVRASCSIPFFFQAVAQGATRLVDGGLLSNLPAFVFARDHGERPLSDRILAFRLEAIKKEANDW